MAWASRFMDTLAGDESIGRHTFLDRDETAGREPGFARQGLHGGLFFFDCKVNCPPGAGEYSDAEARGAAVANYASAHVNGKRVQAHDSLTGESLEINARRVVDATGAWSGGATLRLVRGSHLVSWRS